MKSPIPREALDDRLGFVGNAGGGKTYSAGTAALAQAFQFDGTMRQKDIIGEWVPLDEPGPLSDVISGSLPTNIQNAIDAAIRSAVGDRESDATPQTVA